MDFSRVLADLHIKVALADFLPIAALEDGHHERDWSVKTAVDELVRTLWKKYFVSSSVLPQLSYSSEQETPLTSAQVLRQHFMSWLSNFSHHSNQRLHEQCIGVNNSVVTFDVFIDIHLDKSIFGDFWQKHLHYLKPWVQLLDCLEQLGNWQEKLERRLRGNKRAFWTVALHLEDRQLQSHQPDVSEQHESASLYSRLEFAELFRLWWGVEWRSRLGARTALRLCLQWRRLLLESTGRTCYARSILSVVSFRPPFSVLRWRPNVLPRTSRKRAQMSKKNRKES